jgi:signal transduction histidine kinase
MVDLHMNDRTTSTAARWALAIGPAIALIMVVVAGLWHLRYSAIEAEQRELIVLSVALADEIDRGLQDAQEGLQAMSLELHEDSVPVSGAEIVRVLQTRGHLMPLVDRLWLVDFKGRVLSASDPGPVPAVTSFLPALDRLGKNSIGISRPFADARNHREAIAVAMRFSDSSAPGGGGWIFAAVPASALLGAFSVASPLIDARMAVFRSDGIRLAGALGESRGTAAVGGPEQPANSGPFELRQVRDGDRSLVAIRHLPRFGLKMVLTRNLDAVLTAWRQIAQLTAGGISILLAVVAASGWRVRRADRRRDKAQKALQLQLARASKLEALGTLAGGVAHDFNNVLAAIVGFGEMAQDAAAKGSDQERQIGKVLQAAVRGKTLIERILTFSRGGARTSTVFELEPIVEEVLGLQSASLPKGVVLERALDAPGARLRGDPAQAFETVMNLCTNAMQAMPDGGRLSVRLAAVHVAAARVLSHSRLEPGHYLALAVQDNGTGMTPEVMEHLFEPFFTTRGEQSGTGLGLAVVHGVVAECGGAIDVQASPGQGACFTLYLPECHDPVAAPAAPIAKPAPCGAGPLVLVVDDEPALVAMATEMLKGLGYDGEGHTDPVAALAAVRANPSRYAAVITDQVMPVLTGTELTRELRATRPGLPILLVTGYGGALLAARAAEAGITRLLSKPLQRAELARALEELLR